MMNQVLSLRSTEFVGKDMSISTYSILTFLYQYKPLLSTYYVPSIVISPMGILTHFILRTFYR